MTEIQLIPPALDLHDQKRTEVVNCRAPSVSMFGPDKLAVKAKRIARCLWRVTTFSNPRKWRWWGERPVVVPRVEHGWWWYLNPMAGIPPREYWNYLRFVDVSAHSQHLESTFLGPDNFVVAYEMWPAQTYWQDRGTRRVLYLSAHDEGDGLTTPPGLDCLHVSGGRIVMKQPSDKVWAECQKHRSRYREMVQATAEGKVPWNDGTWITVEERNRRQREADEEYRRYRLATGR
jgi:hypothetical protein